MAKRGFVLKTLTPVDILNDEDVDDDNGDSRSTWPLRVTEDPTEICFKLVDPQHPGDRRRNKCGDAWKHRTFSPRHVSRATVLAHVHDLPRGIRGRGNGPDRHTELLHSQWTHAKRQATSACYAHDAWFHLCFDHASGCSSRRSITARWLQSVHGRKRCTHSKSKPQGSSLTACAIDLPCRRYFCSPKLEKAHLPSTVSSLDTEGEMGRVVVVARLEQPSTPATRLMRAGGGDYCTYSSSSARWSRNSAKGVFRSGTDVGLTVFPNIAI